METVRNNMLAVGVEDLNLRGTHILLSMNSSHEIVTGGDERKHGSAILSFSEEL
jgi:hypothetical protein